MPSWSTGEQVTLHGTGRRWTGKVFNATVVDAGDGETVKVQFADGGYKRFSKADFEKAMVQDTENAVVTESFKFEVGKVIFLQGVGRWSDQTFRAEVVEMREGDDSVKVRYLNGGFKRYSRPNLGKLVDRDTVDDGSRVFESLTEKEIKSAFAEADANANGLIDSHEVRVCLKAVGQNIPMPVAKKLVQDHGSGKEGIDLDDFRRLVRAREQTCRALYDLLKGKADMSLRLFNSDDRERVGKNLTSLLGTQFNAKVFLEMVAAMDRDDDGAVSFKEFQRALLFSSVLGGEHGIYGVVQTSLSFMGFTDNPPNVPAWMSLVSGFTAGIISRTLTHPMERASIVMRAATDGAGLPTVVKRIVEKDGPTGLWTGNAANCCQVAPEMALNFFLYESLKKQFLADPTKPSSSEKFMCGSAAGAIANTLVYPMNSVSMRLAVAPVGLYSGIADCFKKTWTEGGALVFFGGYTANLPRMILVRGGEMTIFTSLAEKFVPEGETITPTQGLCFGGFSSGIMTAATYPLMLARTKVQTQGTAGIPILYDNFVDALRKTYSGHEKLGIPRGGFGGLFAGLTACLTKFVPAQALHFMIYSEIMKRFQTRLRETQDA